MGQGSSKQVYPSAPGQVFGESLYAQDGREGPAAALPSQVLARLRWIPPERERGVAKNPPIEWGVVREGHAIWVPSGRCAGVRPRRAAEVSVLVYRSGRQAFFTLTVSNRSPLIELHSKAERVHFFFSPLAPSPRGGAKTFFHNLLPCLDGEISSV